MRPEKQTASDCLGNSFTHGQTPPSPCPPNHTKHTPWLWVIHRVERQAWTPYFFHSRRDIGDHPAECLKDPTEETMVEKWEAGGGGLGWGGGGLWLLFHGAQCRWISSFTPKCFPLMPCQFLVFQNARGRTK